jgi:hypothetical protein
MRQIFIIVVCAFTLLASGSYAESLQPLNEPVQPLKWIESNGETVIVATSAKLNVQVKITTHEVQIGKPSDPWPDVIRSSCTYTRHPCRIVDDI